MANEFRKPDYFGTAFFTTLGVGSALVVLGVVFFLVSKILRIL